VTEVSGGEAADDLAQRAAGDDWRIQALGLTRVQQTAERDPEDQHRDRFDLLRDQHQQYEDAAHVGQCQQPERQQRRRQHETDTRQQRQLRAPCRHAGDRGRARDQQQGAREEGPAAARSRQCV
jgi:hypothetical protein